MTTEQKLVKKWNQTAGINCPDKPTIPDLETRKICAKLILEEALEIINKGLGLSAYNDCESPSIDIDYVRFMENASAPGNLVEIGDGCADLQVVNLGCASRCGIDLEPVFDEVMRSNNSKWWIGYEVHECTNPDYTFTLIAHSYDYVAKDRTGKVRKSPHYFKPAIEPILKAQGL